MGEQSNRERFEHEPSSSTQPVRRVIFLSGVSEA